VLDYPLFAHVHTIFLLCSTCLILLLIYHWINYVLQLWISIKSCSCTWRGFDSHFSNKKHQYWWKKFLIYICISYILVCIRHKVCTLF
jgi:hypothetical protein